jgi:hypothetical protein
VVDHDVTLAGSRGRVNPWQAFRNDRALQADLT